MIHNDRPHFANVRKDIIEREESVPIGNDYYGEKEPLPYRWFNDKIFQIFYKGNWQKAESIDWDFE